MFYFHPYLGKISNLTSIFSDGWFNHQPKKDVPHCATPSENLMRMVVEPKYYAFRR